MGLNHRAAVQGPGMASLAKSKLKICETYGCSDYMLHLQPPKLGSPRKQICLEHTPNFRPGRGLADWPWPRTARPCFQNSLSNILLHQPCPLPPPDTAGQPKQKGGGGNLDGNMVHLGAMPHDWAFANNSLNSWRMNCEVYHTMYIGL